MTRYLVLPTLIVFALGIAAGWSLRAGRSTPRDVWDDAHWWAKGFDDGMAIQHAIVGPTPAVIWIPECGDQYPTRTGSAP